MQENIIAIGLAFLFGLGARLVGLPPLVGYLIAGFVLFAAGMEATPTLHQFSEIGVTLLLFSIGLKMRIGSLLMPQVWGVASLHMGLTVLLFATGIFAFGALGVTVFSGLDVPLIFLVGFALCFSSTVFAVKVLEEKGEMNAVYGRISIGILIMQDIAAVVFLAASTGKVPSLWALLLLAALFPLRPALGRMLERCGHGELMILFGLTLALGGAKVFELVGIKGDLGALILGLLLSTHPWSHELARHLLGFKDLFLVGFFLTIGLAGPLTPEAVAVALLLVALVPLKVMLFFWLLARFRLRARTAFLTSLSLANYSEFGLIVASIAMVNGWMGSEWLIIIALALSISFILAAPLNTRAHQLYTRYRESLHRHEVVEVIPADRPINPGQVAVVIFGMGRVGSGAYEALHERVGDAVVGVDIDKDRVEAQRAAGRNVVRGSVTDPDFWERFQIDYNKLGLVMLAMPNQLENLFAARQLRALGYEGRLAAVAKYADEVTALREAGVDSAFNLYAEAGAGFAEDVAAELASEKAG
ncbi:MAG: cation:proton antiporter [Gammaproteobacteria bacterium]|jgi:predicted Kef-type K+ transport protein